MISVIIPTLNEADHLGQLLGTLSASDLVTQVIVVDGGSYDNTRQIAAGFSVEVYQAEKGRASQMNFGAEKAQGDTLLFIHADSKLSLESIEAIPAALEQAEAGCFYLQFDKGYALLRLYSWFSKFNQTYFTYGDQGLFIKKEVFQQLGGFREIPIFEDLDMVIRIKQETSFKKLKYPICTSARRFTKHGVLRQQLKNIILVGLFVMGVNPHKLTKFYRY